MAKRFSSFAALALTGALLAFAGAAQADDVTAGSLKISHVFARATPGGAKVAGAFVTIRNEGKEADVLTGVQADIAGRAEIHEMKIEDGIMKMRGVQNLPVPAAGALELKPGSYHIMLQDLKSPLKQGESFKGTLTFEKAGPVPVTFTIESIAAGAPHDHSTHDHADHDHSDHDHAH